MTPKRKGVPTAGRKQTASSQSAAPNRAGDEESYIYIGTPASDHEQPRKATETRAGSGGVASADEYVYIGAPVVDESWQRCVLTWGGIEGTVWYDAISNLYCCELYRDGQHIRTFPLTQEAAQAVVAAAAVRGINMKPVT